MGRVAFRRLCTKGKFFLQYFPIRLNRPFHQFTAPKKRFFAPRRTDREASRKARAVLFHARPGALFLHLLRRLGFLGAESPFFFSGFAFRGNTWETAPVGPLLAW